MMETRPFGRPLTEAEAKRLLRGLDLPVEDEEVKDALDTIIRRARASGMILGGTLSLVAFTVAIILRGIIAAHWPVTCDGTGSLIVCGLRLVGVAS